MWDHIKNTPGHNAENYAIDWIGSVPGMSESRRLVGDYILNENDILENKFFDDGVAFGGWPIDVHPSKGFHHKGLPTRYINFPGHYSIPYRCFYSKNIENLMMAGRNISVSKLQDEGFLANKQIKTHKQAKNLIPYERKSEQIKINKIFLKN